MAKEGGRAGRIMLAVKNTRQQEPQICDNKSPKSDNKSPKSATNLKVKGSTSRHQMQTQYSTSLVPKGKGGRVRGVRGREAPGALGGQGGGCTARRQ